jgi:hypothetical protein
MSFEEFLNSARDRTVQSPPDSFTGALAALWWDHRGEWDRAHDSAQGAAGHEGAWVHAYLHRKEGDSGNAGYWYRRAGKPPLSGSLAAEWEAIVRSLL